MRQANWANYRSTSRTGHCGHYAGWNGRVMERMEVIEQTYQNLGRIEVIEPPFHRTREKGRTLLNLLSRMRKSTLCEQVRESASTQDKICILMWIFRPCHSICQDEYIISTFISHLGTTKIITMMEEPTSIQPMVGVLSKTFRQCSMLKSSTIPPNKMKFVPAPGGLKNTLNDRARTRSLKVEGKPISLLELRIYLDQHDLKLLEVKICD